MKKRKIVRKVSKETKKLLIAMLIGDGTISSNYVFKLSHGEDQKEFILWKIDQINKIQLKNNGLKEYIGKTGYSAGKIVYYSQLSIIPVIKVLRRCVYKPKKVITRELLNWLDPKGLAIWYMDDGHININNSIQRGNSVQKSIKFATCVDLNTVEIIIKYFKEVWDINFRKFSEGSGTFSISSCSEEDIIKFIKIVKPYILEVPSLLYKIRNNYTKKEFIELQQSGFEMRDIIF